MTWRIEVLSTEPRPPHALLADFLAAGWAWKRLTKPAREAVVAAYPDSPVKAHWRTRDSLTLHGFAAWDNAAQDWLLTDAGKAVAKWNANRG